MTISLDNRSRLVLLVFCVLDHAVWYYGGHFEQASMVYVVLSECIRMLALVIVLASFYEKRLLTPGVYMVMLYCTIMIPLNIYGSYSYKHGTQALNPFFFKKQDHIPIHYAFQAFFFYAFYVLFSYTIAAKHMSLHLLKKR